MTLDDKIFLELENIYGHKIAIDPLQITEMVEEGGLGNEVTTITTRSGQKCRVNRALWHIREQSIWSILRERERLMGLKQWGRQ